MVNGDPAADSVLVGAKAKDAAIWLPRFIHEVENLQGNITRVCVIYGSSRDSTYSLLKHWQRTSRHKVEVYAEPYLPEIERNGATLARLKRDMQDLLRQGKEKYYLNLDCDLVSIPQTIIPELMKRDKDLIAGMVWTEGRTHPTFFDTYEYRKEDCMFDPYDPPGNGQTEPFTVDSVSTCYLAKAEAELAGVYTNPYPHIPFCKTLKDKGYQIWVDPTVNVYHVDLEAYGILHPPIYNSPYNNAQFIKNNGLKYPSSSVAAERFELASRDYDLNWRSLLNPHQFDAVQTWLDKRPLITASLKALNEADYIRSCLDSIYPYVDKIDIVYGAMKQTSHITYRDETPKILQEYPDSQHKITVLDGFWQSKEQIQAKLLEVCMSKWMLYIDADEILTAEGGEAMRQFCQTHQHGEAVYARPKRFYNYLHDFRHIAWSLNPLSPWAEYGQPHPFLIWRDISGLNFSSFHTYPTDSYGQPVHVDNPRYTGKQHVLDGVVVHHFGNAKSPERILDKLRFERRRDRNPEPAEKDWWFTGDMPQEFVVGDIADEDVPAAVREHPLFGRSLIKVTQTKPNYRFELT